MRCVGGRWYSVQLTPVHTLVTYIGVVRVCSELCTRTTLVASPRAHTLNHTVCVGGAWYSIQLTPVHTLVTYIGVVRVCSELYTRTTLVGSPRAHTLNHTVCVGGAWYSAQLTPAYLPFTLALQGQLMTYVTYPNRSTGLYMLARHGSSPAYTRHQSIHLESAQRPPTRTCSYYNTLWKIP
jgi:hypothetical protein